MTQTISKETVLKVLRREIVVGDLDRNTRTKRMTKCEACKGHGWLLCTVDTNPVDMEIQRCDACERFADDNVATTFVAKIAWKERPHAA